MKERVVDLGADLTLEEEDKLLIGIPLKSINKPGAATNFTR